MHIEVSDKRQEVRSKKIYGTSKNGRKSAVRGGDALLIFGNRKGELKAVYKMRRCTKKADIQ